ncbi:MAG: hypothetical protein ACK5Z5_02295 [Neisseriaceae bacterium]|jgi:cation transport ATPase
MNQQFDTKEQYTYCKIEDRDLKKRIDSLKARSIWCIFFTIICISVSSLSGKLFGIPSWINNGADIYIEFICVSLIFFCGANNYLVMTYFKFKDNLGTLKDVFLFVILIAAYITSMITLLINDNDVYSLQLIITIDLLLLVSLLRYLLIAKKYLNK